MNRPQILVVTDLIRSIVGSMPTKSKEEFLCAMTAVELHYADEQAALDPSAAFYESDKDRLDQQLYIIAKLDEAFQE